MFIFNDILRFSGRVFINLIIIELMITVLRMGPRMIRKKIRKGFGRIQKILEEKDERAAK